MNLLVLQATAIAGSGYSIPDWSYAIEEGHTIDSVTPDAIISMSISQMDRTFIAHREYPGVPIFCYNWDVYKWVWDNPRPGEYNYKQYGELLSEAEEIWVPSNCTGRRVEEWYGLTNWNRILSSVNYWDCDSVRDDGYALCCLREIPDPRWGIFQKTCQRLGIPYRETLHGVTYEEYKDAVAHCRFLVAPLYELSTGGLSLLEGYNLGKPCLISDSEWNGGRDYLGPAATYFVDGDERDFGSKLASMYVNTPTVSDESKEYMACQFTDKRMVQNMLSRIEINASKL